MMHFGNGDKPNTCWSWYDSLIMT